jgi:zinc metalloprotease ZmpB
MTHRTARRSTALVTALGLCAVTAVATGAASVEAAPVSHGADTTATVFLPNPVQQLGDQTLTDRKDADYAALAPAYRRVTLTELDASGSLSGRYVRVRSETGSPVVVSGTALPAYHRDVDQFEQVMGYYWVTTAHHYLESLGFGADLRPVNDRQIELRVDQYGGDNSFFRDTKADITLGKGGVDDAEDAEVIVHEYGHSVQDSQVPGFGTDLESGSIGEGFSDYLAVAVTEWAAGSGAAKDPACVADWDSVSYTRSAPHCLRRLDGTKVYPADVRGEVHADGEIWSSALWAIRGRLGDTRASRVIIEAQFRFAAGTSFTAAAQATVDTARDLYGAGVATTVRQAFRSRGLLS